MFAKLFGPPEDQVLVKVESAEDGPEVRIYFEPPGLGVCSVAVSFPDTDAGWDAAEAILDTVDEAKARATIATAQRQMGVDIAAFAPAADAPAAAG